MARAKTSTVRRKKHKKVLKLAKGFRGANNRLFKRAREAVLHAGQYAYAGRKLRKRDMRKLWIIRINSGLTAAESKLNYSRFIKALSDKQIEINRKMLADLAANDMDAFKEIVNQVS